MHVYKHVIAVSLWPHVSRQPTLHKDPFSIEASVLSEYLLIITEINYVYTGQMARSPLCIIQLPVYFLVCLTTCFLSGRVLSAPDVALLCALWNSQHARILVAYSRKQMIFVSAVCLCVSYKCQPCVRIVQGQVILVVRCRNCVRDSLEPVRWEIYL
jgi:hypothetical protein